MLRLRKLRACGIVGALLILSAISCPALAGEGGTDDAPPAPTGVGPREVWAGVDTGAHNWLVYTGGTYAPESDIHADGFRLRATTGYGEYDYHWDIKTRVKVSKTYADAMVGYQLRYGELTTKIFAGWALLDNTYNGPWPVVRRTVIENGPRGALELWLNIGSTAWTSLDLNFADTRAVWSVRSRTGYRILPTVSLGGEAIFNHADLTGEVQASTKFSVSGNSRLGGFARYEWFGGEISASGGVSGDWIDSHTGSGGTDVLHNPSAYGTLNLILQF